MARLVLHIGTHKTGTTSFQRWFRDHRDEVHRLCGATIYDGVFRDARELGAICIDTDRETPGLHRRHTRGPDHPSPMPVRGTAEWQQFVARVTDSLHAQHRAATGAFVVSSESLSLLRRPAEIARLRTFLPDAEVSIVVCLRRPEDFLRSWKRHLDRDFFELNSDADSFANVRPDSWLVNYAEILRVWRAEFGDEAVHAIDYDDAVRTLGSTIPALLRHVAPDAGPWPAWDHYVLNTAGKAPRRPVRGVAAPRHWLRWWRWNAWRAMRRAVATLTRPVRRRSSRR